MSLPGAEEQTPQPPLANAAWPVYSFFADCKQNWGLDVRRAFISCSCFWTLVWPRRSMLKEIWIWARRVLGAGGRRDHVCGKWEQEIKLQELAPNIKWRFNGQAHSFLLWMFLQKCWEVERYLHFNSKNGQLLHSAELSSLRFQQRNDTQGTRFREPCLCQKGKESI